MKPGCCKAYYRPVKLRSTLYLYKGQIGNLLWNNYWVVHITFIVSSRQPLFRLNPTKLIAMCLTPEAPKDKLLLSGKLRSAIH